jgi:ferritin-like metal-binding protein YciE
MATTKTHFMERMNDLKDLLKHEVMDLYSVEEQILSALPMMIEKTKNRELKKALQDHRKVTEQQKDRLDQVMQLLNGGQEMEGQDKKEGLLSRLFKRTYTCKGMEGILEEGNQIMGEDMAPEVLDAAIIASAQKVEHYEICGYGTARTYARELGLEEVARLLEQTLNEEYHADDLLTQLAESRINMRAEKGAGKGMGDMAGTSGRSTTTGRTQGARREQPEIAMASNTTTGRAAGAKRGTTTGAGSASPKSTEMTRGTTSTSRTTGAAAKRTTSGGTAGRTENKTAASRKATNGRGGTSGRGTEGGRSGSRTR